jgi:hypothetical protein
MPVWARRLHKTTFLAAVASGRCPASCFQDVQDLSKVTLVFA